MIIKGRKITIRQVLNTLVISAALALLSVLPIAMAADAYFEEMGGGVPILVRTANLVSPTGSINPHGDAEYELYANGNREIEVEAEDINAPNGTVYTMFVDGNQIGQASLFDQRVRLKLRTEDGQSVPVTNDGSTVQVRRGSTLVVSGVFGGGGPNPSPSPTSSPTASPSASPTASPTASPSPTSSPSPTASPSPSPGESEIYAALNGSTINGVLPRGYAAYEIHSSRTEIEVRIRQISLPSGSQFGVSIEGQPVGNMFLESDGESRLRLRSDDGDFVPVVIPGDVIEIAHNGNVILSGSFSGTSSTPSPSPSPGESPTPSPSPSPGFATYFESHPSGSGFNPPIITSGRAEVKVILNEAGTQATFSGEFHDLTSSQISATVFADLGDAVTVFTFTPLGGTNGNLVSKTVAVTQAQVDQLRAGLWFATIATQNNPSGELRGRLTQHSDSADFDGDGSNDIAVFRPSGATWYSMNSQGFNASVFGTSTDQPVSADYDGDGKTDKAVVRDYGGSAVWIINRSSDGGETAVAFGYSTDIPVRGDFDGDGLNDIAVFRPSNGVWYVKKSNNSGLIVVQFGVFGDRPVASDFDGDGKADISVYRPSNGVWYRLNSSDGSFAALQWGVAEDKAVRGDFDGDGKDDHAVFRPSNGVWYIYQSSNGQFLIRQFGIAEDIPVAGRYDGDDKTDIAVFRPSSGLWYIWRSEDGTLDVRQFGVQGDIPIIR